LLLLAVLYFAASAFSALLPHAGAGWERTMFQLALFSVGGLYFGWSWSEGRRSLPMSTWQLRLQTRAGQALNWHRALKRYFFAWCAPLLALGGYLAAGPWGLSAATLPYLWALLDQDRQFLHDRLAGTRLVRDLPTQLRKDAAA
jgi:uncharacterized RDD family membrane protein YckC